MTDNSTDFEKRAAMMRQWVGEFGTVTACAQAMGVNPDRISQCFADAWFPAKWLLRARQAGETIGAEPPEELFKFDAPAADTSANGVAA